MKTRVAPSLLALLVITILWQAPSRAIAAPERVVCIGDSITQGRGDHSRSGQPWFSTDGWRYDFWKLTVDNNYPIEFVGTMTEGFESTPVYADYKGQKFQNRHEARWGWNTEDVLKKIREVHTQWKADIALIYLGTNQEPATDAEKVTDPNGVTRTVAAMRGLVTLLQQDNPHVIIVIRALVGDARRAGLDDGYRKLATDLSTPDSKIVVVDQSPGWQWDPKQPDSDTVDGCHPNKKGDAKLATDFWNALKPLLAPASAFASPGQRPAGVQVSVAK